MGSGTARSKGLRPSRALLGFFDSLRTPRLAWGSLCQKKRGSDTSARDAAHAFSAVYSALPGAACRMILMKFRYFTPPARMDLRSLTAYSFSCRSQSSQTSSLDCISDTSSTFAPFAQPTRLRQ